MMKTFKIFTDMAMDDAGWKLLRNGAAPHQIVLPEKPAASVLSKSGPDPALMAADIAFGQPDATGVLQAPQLRWLQISSAGYTRYDTTEFRKAAAGRGLSVSNSSTVYAEPCAEHVLAFMLAQSRRLPVALASRSENGSDDWFALRDSCRLLRGQNVLMLGFGAIAKHLIDLLRPFDVEITALRRNRAADDIVSVITVEGLPDALAKADHVVNILPDNADSARFMSAERFGAMKKGAVFYNIGRGATVDRGDLAEALRSGHLAAAWLDVTDPEPLPAEHPLLRAPNCFITPHVGGGHQNEAHTLVRHFLDNLCRFLDGSDLRDRIM
jgi:phosphoglycerate dehydrogenase-like enzyme